MARIVLSVMYKLFAELAFQVAFLTLDHAALYHEQRRW